MKKKEVGSMARRPLWAGLGLAALLGSVALWTCPHRLEAQTGQVANAAEAQTGQAASAADTQSTLAAAREVQQNGASAGEVDVHGKPVLTIQSASGGYSPLERAQAVARRINDLAVVNKLQNIHTGYQNGEVVVLSDGGEIVTASHDSALLNHTTPSQLADMWANNLKSALNSGSYTYSGSRPYAQPLPVEEHDADKLVPILSAGTGLRLGGAIVTGPSSRVAATAAVAQIEGKFKNIAEARALVPVSNPAVQGNLSRVPEVSVYAVVDYRLP